MYTSWCTLHSQRAQTDVKERSLGGGGMLEKSAELAVGGGEKAAGDATIPVPAHVAGSEGRLMGGPFGPFDVPSFPARSVLLYVGGGFLDPEPVLGGRGGPGVGVVNVSRQIASNLDAHGNWIYTDAIYCSYSFKADDAEYYGEQLTRIDAFTFGEVQSYCYMSTSEDRSGRECRRGGARGDASVLSATRPTRSVPVGDRRIPLGQGHRHGPRG